MTSIAGAILMFAVLLADRVYNGELGAITGVVDGKLQWLREQQLAFAMHGSEYQLVHTSIPKLSRRRRFWRSRPQ